jgi:hypothetical protein
MSDSTFSDLQRTKVLYDHVREMAREIWCKCNSARHSSEIARDICEYLLRGGREVGEMGDDRVEGGVRRCPFHKAPILESPLPPEVADLVLEERP